MRDRMVRLVMRRQRACAFLGAGWPQPDGMHGRDRQPVPRPTIVIRGGREREGHIRGGGCASVLLLAEAPGNRKTAFYKLNLKVKFFSCHFVVCIKSDRCFFFCGYFNREWLSVLVGQVYLLAYSKVF